MDLFSYLLCTVVVHKGPGPVMKPAVTAGVWVVSVLGISSVNTHTMSVDKNTHTHTQILVLLPSVFRSREQCFHSLSVRLCCVLVTGEMDRRSECV